MKSAAIKAIALGLVALLPGCIVYQYPQRGQYSQQPGYATNEVYVDEGPVVQTAPPAPLVEVVPVAPSPEFVWIGGDWLFEFGGYHWHNGYYGHRPYGGAFWFPGYYGHEGGGYCYHHGHWH